MSNPTVTGNGHTVFQFSTEGITLEFAGTEAFVEKQVARFRGFLHKAVGMDHEAGEAVEVAIQERERFADFAAERPIREGRGSIQDRILLALHYLHRVHGKSEVSGDDILYCFQDAAWEDPKSLHNTLGILKRKLELLQEGSKRGLYALSAKGRKYVESRFS